MPTLLIGAHGNMGKRYKEILEGLGEPVVPLDLGMSVPKEKTYNRILIAAPTDTHVPLIRSFMDQGKPILCEKPICKDPDELNFLLQDGPPILRMVDNYRFLPGLKRRPGYTTYNYFKHGNDGLVWDCIQVIWNAWCWEADLYENSPVFELVINGIPFNLSDFDQTYVDMLASWLDGEVLTDATTLWRLHKRVKEIDESTNRDTGALNEHSLT